MTSHRLLIHGITIVGALALVGCGDDDGDGNGVQEPTAFRVRVENVAPFTHLKSGTFDTPVDADSAGPLAPGESYEITFTAAPGDRLGFATMFGQSNDWFFAPMGGSIALYQDGTPISGNITDRVALYDAGTEIDEEPAVGPHTAPNQDMSTDGPGAVDPNSAVRAVPDPVTLTAGGQFDRPAISEMIQVTITPDPDSRQFILQITNVSQDGATLQTSAGGQNVRVSPGAWIVGSDENPLFTPGEPDRGEGLEAIAEGGDPERLAQFLEPLAGVATPISPGIYVVHTNGSPLFLMGEPEPGIGLEVLAEMGDPSLLSDAYREDLPPDASSFGVFDTAVNADDAGPIEPGQAYELDFMAMPGERLSLAAMYGLSNDWIFASDGDGIELFEASDPQTGDVTDQIAIWDVGTEADQEPGVGPDIGAPEGAADDDNTVRRVSDDVYPVSASEHIRVTLETR